MRQIPMDIRTWLHQRVRMNPLRARARQLRNAPTDAERYLWQILRVRQLDGYRFRRQVPLGGYIADFACAKARLIIELDGGQHAERIVQDTARTVALERLDYRVLRYWNHEVLMQADDVVTDILRHLTDQACNPLPASPFAPRKGRGKSSLAAP